MTLNSTAVSIIFADDCLRNLLSGLKEILKFLDFREKRLKGTKMTQSPTINISLSVLTNVFAFK